MTRHTSHILGDKAERKLSVLFPFEWTISKPVDYGIDGVVEIFDNNLPTGHIFNYQSKGTSIENLNEALKVQIMLERLRYFHKLSNPTLIIRYLEEKDNFYGKWSNHINIKNLSDDQKMLTITFEESDKMDENFIESIPIFVENRKIYRSKLLKFPLDIKIEIEIDNFNSYSVNRLEFETNKILKEINTLRNIDSPGVLTISFQEHKIKINFLDQVFESIVASDLSSNKERIVNSILYKVLKLISMYNYLNEVKQELIKCFLDSDYTKNEIELHFLFDLFLKNGNNSEAIEFVELLDQESKEIFCKNSMLSLLFQIIRLKIDDIDLINRWSVLNDNMNKILDSNATNRAVNHYNRANMLSNSSCDYRASIREYVKAAKINPDYKNRYYYWREFGAALFESKHYGFAKRAYEKASEIEFNDNLIPLIADCNLNLGKFDISKNRLEEYFNQKSKLDSNNACWMNKLYMIDSIIEIIGIKSQKRERIKSEDSMYYKENGIELDYIIALKYDVFNEAAWFNLALYYNRNNDCTKSFKCFRNCLVINSRDYEAWENCIKLLLNSYETVHVEFTYLFNMLHKTYGLSFFEMTIDMVDSWDMEKEGIELIFEVLTHLHKNELKNQFGPIVYNP